MKLGMKRIDMIGEDQINTNEKEVRNIQPLKFPVLCLQCFPSLSLHSAPIFSCPSVWTDAQNFVLFLLLHLPAKYHCQILTAASAFSGAAGICLQSMKHDCSRGYLLLLQKQSCEHATTPNSAQGDTCHGRCHALHRPPLRSAQLLQLLEPDTFCTLV